MTYRGKLEYAHQRKIRARNTRLYRLAHWPLWIWVFFLAPGPLTFSLFAHGFGRGNSIWLALVLLGTGIAALRGSLPGAEPAPYILRFDEDKPNPLYRRVCYTFAWSAVLSFALLNFAGLVIATATGVWYLKQIYWYAYAPLSALILLLGAAGVLPRVRIHQRRRDRAALLLRRGVGGGGEPGVTGAGVEAAARDERGQRDQVGYLCGCAAGDGPGRRTRLAATHTSHPARRIDGGRLRLRC
jgi:hypothetical protein